MLCFCFWLIVQILLESFPISSSGHCLLLEQFLSKYQCHINHYQDFFLHNKAAGLVRVALLDHFVHGVTVILVAYFFFSRWLWFFVHMRRCWRIVLKVIAYTSITDMITALFYMLFACFSVQIPLYAGFLITSLLLFSLRFVPARMNESLNWRKACVLGAVQGIALLPGISRFAATYVCARWLMLYPRRAFEVSWLIVWPLIAVAFFHSAGIIIITAPNSVLLQPLTWFIMMCAGVVAFYGLKFVAQLAYKEKLWWIGVYMIVPTIIAFIMR